jgi:hypothetical protein
MAKHLTIEESLGLQALALRVLDDLQEMERQLAALHGDSVPTACPPLVKICFDYRDGNWNFTFRSGRGAAEQPYSVSFPAGPGQSSTN